MSETVIPTCDFRWFTDYDGERILQQRVCRPNGTYFWQRLPEWSYEEDVEQEREIRRRQRANLQSSKGGDSK